MHTIVKPMAHDAGKTVYGVLRDHFAIASISSSFRMPSFAKAQAVLAKSWALKLAVCALF